MTTEWYTVYRESVDVCDPYSRKVTLKNLCSVVSLVKKIMITIHSGMLVHSFVTLA